MSNPIKVEIKDFQSLKNVKIELIDGVNIITGKTNSGKSAIIRAIDSALFNMGDDSMVRAGCRYSAVLIDNGNHKMIFSRDSHGKNEKTAYQFDGGTVQKKVGRTQLPEVAQMFNIRDVRMQNNTKMKINFWYQNDKPFLMDKTSNQLYEFLSLSSCDKYSKILKQMVVDMKVQEADINNITTEIDTLKSINNEKMKFVDMNKGFDDVYVDVITLNQKCSESNEIERLLCDVRSARETCAEKKATALLIKEKIDSIPMESLSKEYSSVINRDNSNKSVEVEIHNITEIKNSISKDISKLSSISDELSKCSQVEKDCGSRIEVVQDKEKHLNEVNNGIEIYKKDDIRKRSLEDRLKNIYNSNINTEDIEKGLNSIINRHNVILGIESVISGIKSIENDISNKREKLQGIQNSMVNEEANLAQLKKDIGVCPFCGSVFN